MPAGTNSTRVEVERLARLLGDGQVGVVDRVEDAAQDAPALLGHSARRPTRARRCRCGPCRPAITPALTSSRSTPSLRQVALEALGRFGVVEVGLRGEPLDAPAGNAVGARPRADGEDVGPGLEAVHDHAGRLGRPAASRRRAAARPASAMSLSMPVRGSAEMATTGSCRARGPREGRLVVARVGQVDLVGDDEGHLVEQLGIVRLELARG